MKSCLFFLLATSGFSLAAETLTFDSDLEGFGANADSTSVEWSPDHGGSLKATVKSGWAGNSLKLGLRGSSLWPDLQQAALNGGSLSFDFIVDTADQASSLADGSTGPNWLQPVVIGNSTNADNGGTGGWDQTVVNQANIPGGTWPLTPAVQVIPVVVPIQVEATGSVSNDGELYLATLDPDPDVEDNPYWVELVLGLNGQGAAFSADPVFYIDNLTVTAFSANTNEWPGGRSYTTDFSGPLVPYWSFSGWSQTSLPTPIASLTRNQSDQAQWGLNQAIGDSDANGPSGYFFNPDTGTASMSDAGEPFATPLAVTNPPVDLSTLDPGFGGSWIQSIGSDTRSGKATLTFENLPPHRGLDLDFVIAAFDTIDPGDWIGNDPDISANPDANSSNPLGDSPNFRIVVDGVTVYENRFDNSGFIFDFSEGVTELGTNLNYSAQYRENWGQDNSGAIPTDANDRHPIAWTNDAAYNFNNLFDDNLKAIPHTADTVTIEFFHGFDQGATSGYQDEGIAMDGFTLTLVGAGVPPPLVTSVVPSAGSVEITWADSAAAESYLIERSTDLTTWTEIDDGATGTRFTDFSPPASGAIFYRIIRN
ncbi:MAG: hypothetical protein ACON5H_03340 [Akkermansiaceae bacterium]